MSAEAVAAYLDGRDPGAARLFRAFRTAALAAGTGVEEKVSKTMVAWRSKRSFASAYVKGRYLECTIDLLHAVEIRTSRLPFTPPKR